MAVHSVDWRVVKMDTEKVDLKDLQRAEMRVEMMVDSKVVM